MNIKINDRDITLKYSMRAIMLYEAIQKKPFAPESTTDVLVFLYCVLMGSAKDLDLDFNNFLDIVDDNPSILVDFSEWLTSEISKNNTLSPEEEKKVTTPQK